MHQKINFIPVIIAHVRDLIAKNDILEDSSGSFDTSFWVEHDWTSKRRCYANIQKGFRLKAGMMARHVEMPAIEIKGLFEAERFRKDSRNLCWSVGAAITIPDISKFKVIIYF